MVTPKKAGVQRKDQLPELWKVVAGQWVPSTPDAYAAAKHALPTVFPQPTLKEWTTAREARVAELLAGLPEDR